MRRKTAKGVVACELIGAGTQQQARPGHSESSEQEDITEMVGVDTLGGGSEAISLEGTMDTDTNCKEGEERSEDTGIRSKRKRRKSEETVKKSKQKRSS